MKKALAIVAITLIHGCSVAQLADDDNKRLGSQMMAEQINNNGPRGFEAHFNTGIENLKHAYAFPAKMYYARTAFERAAILAKDEPLFYFMSGYTHYELGNYQAAYRAFIDGALLEGSADGWWLASIAAIAEGHENLAEALYQKGSKAKKHHSDDLKSFIVQLYERPERSTDIRTTIGLTEGLYFKCLARSDVAQLDNFNSINCDSELMIEFFIVERSLTAGSDIGQDLLNNLSLQTNASLLDRNQLVSDDGQKSRSESSSLTVDIPFFNYSLGLANVASMGVTTTATPKSWLALEKSLKINSGETISLVSQGDDIDSGLEKSHGLTIEASLNSFDRDGANLDIQLEISDLSPPLYIDGFLRLVSKEAGLETVGTVQFDFPFIVGTINSREDTEQSAGQKGLRKIPFFKNIFENVKTSTNRRELIIIGKITPPVGVLSRQEIDFGRSLSVYNIKIRENVRRAALFHAMPNMIEIMGINKLIQSEPLTLKETLISKPS